MPEGQVLEFSGVTKRFGAVTAVNGLTLRVEPGQVTGFLGPNGAGKTTTLRMLLGLVRPTSGSATIGGRAYAQLSDPMRAVGAVLEASSFHPGRTAADHLRVYARAAALPAARVDATLGLVGLADVAGRKVGGFSLGMRQRLGLATALLGDPGVLVLDEPSNGLDPEGIRWMRSLLRTLAAEGRTVLISSHLLAEVQQSVDALVIIANGRLVFQGGIEQLADPDDIATIVDAPDRDALSAELDRRGLSYQVLRTGLTVRGVEPTEIGAIAASADIALSALQRRGQGLEDVFLDLVNGVRTHPSAGPGAGASGDPEPTPLVHFSGDSAAAAPATPENPAADAVTPETLRRSEPGGAAELDPDTDTAEPDPAAGADANAGADAGAGAGADADAATGQPEAQVWAPPDPEAQSQPEPRVEPGLRPDAPVHFSGDAPTTSPEDPDDTHPATDTPAELRRNEPGVGAEAAPPADEQGDPR